MSFALRKCAMCHTTLPTEPIEQYEGQTMETAFFRCPNPECKRMTRIVKMSGHEDVAVMPNTEDRAKWPDEFPYNLSKLPPNPVLDMLREAKRQADHLKRAQIDPSGVLVSPELYARITGLAALESEGSGQYITTVHVEGYGALPLSIAEADDRDVIEHGGVMVIGDHDNRPASLN